MPYVSFPTEYIYWSKIPNHEEIKARCNKKIDALSVESKVLDEYGSNPRDMTFSKFTEKNNFLTDDDLQSLVWKPLEEMLKQINQHSSFKISPKDTFIETYWYSHYEKDYFQASHAHMSNPINKEGNTYYSSFSIVYILEDKHEKSSLVFQKEIPDTIPYTQYHRKHEFDTGNFPDICEGTVIIFPSCTYHYVRHCSVPGRRTIAINLMSCY